MLFDVFISYARNDQLAADQCFEHLRSCGLDVWYDRLCGDERPVFEEIEIALRKSSFVLLLHSQHARAADFVRNEVFAAADLGKKFIPIKLDNRGFRAGVDLILKGTPTLDGRRQLPLGALEEIARRISPPQGASAPVYLLLNMKGGVGKTTLSANLAGTFHTMGKSVLLVDLDAQANLSNLLMSEQQYVEAVTWDRSVLSCFENSLATEANQSAADSLFQIDASGTIPKATQLAVNLRNPLGSQRLDLVVGQFELFKFSLAKNYPHLEPCRARFKSFINEARSRYDVVILDAAPSNSFITECALECATDVVAPTTPDKYALRGIQAISRLMHEGLEMDPQRPVHVVLNNVPAEIGKAEQAIRDAYPMERIDVRLRDSAYFKVRNADPNARVRDPLAELAFMRGDEKIRGALRVICEELLERNKL